MPFLGAIKWPALAQLITTSSSRTSGVTLLIYGDRDAVQRSERLPEFVPDVEVVSLDCGHWIQQEKAEETNQAILKWLDQRDAA